MTQTVYPFGVADLPRIGRAVLSNFLARALPDLYVRLTRQTGRGAGEESAQEVADYFRRCVSDYFAILGSIADDPSTLVRGKCILEYGPGDVPGVALLLIAHGASQVVCVDRFKLVKLSDKNAAILQRLLDGLGGEQLARARECFNTPGDPASGFNETRVRYQVATDGISGLERQADLVLSRAVLEHVNDLVSTFADMHRALLPGGICLHQVDLKSHGLHRHNPLDFLTWPPLLWRWMYGGKGFPNRWRVDRYREAVAAAGFELRLLRATERARREDIDSIRPYLARPFRQVSDEDLTWLGFWLLADKPAER